MIDNRAHHGPVPTELIGERQVPFLVQLRDPEGPIILFRNNVIHQLHCDTFALNDREGAKSKGTLVTAQRAEMKRRISTADPTVDVQQMLSDSADMYPVVFNPPDAWTLGSIDKAGVLGAPMTEAAATEAAEADNRDFLKEYHASKCEVSRGASGSNRNSPSCAKWPCKKHHTWKWLSSKPSRNQCCAT